MKLFEKLKRIQAITDEYEIEQIIKRAIRSGMNNSDTRPILQIVAGILIAGFIIWMVACVMGFNN